MTPCKPTGSTQAKLVRNRHADLSSPLRLLTFAGVALAVLQPGNLRIVGRHGGER